MFSDYYSISISHFHGAAPFGSKGGGVLTVFLIVDDLSPILALSSFSGSGYILPCFFQLCVMFLQKVKKNLRFFFSLDLYVSCVGAASMNITQICVCSTVSVTTFISLNRNYFKTTLFHTGL